MSTTIDNRITSMKFDNKQFESGVATTLGTISKLKSGLNFDGVSKGFDSITNAARNVSLDGLTSGVESVKVKFSALQIMATTALMNITNQAVNAGKKLVSAFTIDPIKDGFKEYETQMNAIQTILANTSSKGTTLKEVKTALGELNTYSDKTIYNFTEMAKNIGTFTAAGVALKPATAAIKGIANLAAVSGSSSLQASTAMYQLSQAMSAGAVTVMDWNSVTSAGMGGEVFRNSLMDTARVHGINIDAMIKKEGSFRQTLESRWLSTEILTETLSKFTGDLNAEQLKSMGYSDKQIVGILKMGVMAYEAATKVKTLTQLMDTLKEAAASGWVSTWETIVGDFEEAKVMFTDVSNTLGGIIGQSSNARNKMLSGWKELGGRTALIDSIKIAFTSLFNIVKTVSQAFKEVFPPMTSKQLMGFTTALKSLMTALTPGRILLTNIHETFKGLFSVLSIGVKIFKFFASIAALVVQALFPITGGVLAVTGGIGTFLTAINDAIEYLGIFDIALKIIAVPIKIIGAVIKFTMTGIAKGIDLVRNALSPYIDKIKAFVKESTFFADIIEKITSVFAPYIARLKEFIKTSTFFADVIDKIKSVFSPYIEKAKEFIKTSTLIEDIMDKISLVMGKAADAIGPYIDKAIEWIKTSTLIEDIVKRVTAALSPYVDKLKEFITTSTFFADAGSKIKEVFNDFIEIAKEFLTTSTFFTDAIDLLKQGWVSAGEGIGPVLSFLKGIFGDFWTFVKELFTGKNVFADALDGTKEVFANAAKGPNTLKNALVGLYNFLVNVKDGFVKIVMSIKETLTPVFTFIIDKFKEVTKNISGGDIGALLAGGGLLMFANMIRKGIGSIDDIISSFTGVMDQLGKSLKAFTLQVKADALLKIAISLGILALALIALSFIDIKDLAKSLGILTVVFAELVIGLIVMDKVMSGTKRVTKGLVGLGIGILLLAFAVKVLSDIPKEKIEQATEAFKTLITMLILFIQLTRGGSLQKSAGGLVAFGIGLLVLVGAMVILSKLDPITLAKGGTALVVLMLAIVAFVNMTKAGDLKKSAGGLTAFAFGLVVLTGALAILGKLKPETLIQGTLALATLMAMIAAFVSLSNESDLIKSSAGLTAFAFGLLILTGALVVLGKLKPETLIQGTLALATLMAMIAAFVSMSDGADLLTSSAGIIAFAAGITILALALKMLGNLSMGSVIQGTVAISVLMGAIALFTRFTNGVNLVVASLGMISFATGLVILTGAVAVLSMLNPDRIKQGVLALAAMIAVIGIFVKVTDGADVMATGVGLKVFAVGILVLAGALAILSALDSQKLLMASGAMAAVIVSFALFVKVTDGKDLMGSAIALILFSGAIAILAKTLELLTTLDNDKLKAAAGSIVLLIGTIALFTKLTSGMDLLSSAAGLLIFSVAIKALTESLVLLSKIDVNALIAATATIVVLLLAIGAFTVLTSSGSLIASAVGLTIFSAAIVVLTGAVFLLGSIPFDTLVKGVGALVIILLAIGLTSVVLAPLAPAILVLSTAMLLFGTACLSVAVAAFIFANALTILGKTGAAGADVLVMVVRKIVALIPEILVTLANGIIKFAITIGNGAPKIAEAFLKVLKAIINTIIVATPLILTCVGVMLTSFLKFLVDAIPKMVDAGMKLVIGILDGITANIGKIIDSAFKLIIAFVNGLADAIRNNDDAIYSACGNLLDAIVKSLLKVSKKLITSGADLIKDLLEGIGSMAKDMFDAGANAVKGFMNGLASMPVKIWDAGKELGRSALDAAKKALDERSPSKAFHQVGAFAGEGMVIGLKSYAGKVANASSDLAIGSLDSAKDALDINSPSKVFKDEVGVMIGRGMADGIKESTPVVETAASKMAKGALDAAKKFIDDKKYYNQISLEEELYVWETLQGKYKAGNDARIESDKEVYRIKAEIIAKDKADSEAVIQAKKDSENAIFDDAVSAMDDLKYYDKLTLEEEYSNWKLVQQYYEEGTDKRIKANKEVYRLEKELNAKRESDAKDLADLNTSYSEKIVAVEKDTTDKRTKLQEDYYAKTKEINDKQISDIDSLNKSYEDAVKSRTQSLYSSSGLFDSVSKPAKTSGAKLIKNLQDQNKEFTSWQENMNGLSGKGVSSGLIEELTAMGPKSLSQIKALNSLTGPELNNYVSLWQQKHDQAKTQAVSELESLRLETLTKVSQINSETTTALTELTNTWSAKTKELNDDSKSKLDLLNKEWSEQIATLSVTTSTQFKDLSEDVKTTVTTLRTDTETEFKELADNLQTTMVTPDWVSVGENIILGIKHGVTNKAVELAQEVARVALMSLTSAKTALGIKSPSTAFAEVGAFCGEGFIIGLSNYGNKMINTAKNVGGGAVDAMANAISSISDTIGDDIASQPVIRPVLDLSDVMAGTSTLNSMFNKNQNISAISSSIQRNNNSTQGATDDLRSIVKSELGKMYPNNQNGVSLNIENFVNNRVQDIENLATEFAFYMKQKQVGGGI